MIWKAMGKRHVKPDETVSESLVKSTLGMMEVDGTIAVERATIFKPC